MNEVRLQNLLKWRKQYESDAKFSDAIGISASYYGQIKRKERSVGEKAARKFEENAGMKAMSLDEDQEKTSSTEEDMELTIFERNILKNLGLLNKENQAQVLNYINYLTAQQNQTPSQGKKGKQKT